MKRAIIVVLFFTLLVGGGLKEVAASGQAWVVIDADTGRLLEGQNENVRLPIASQQKFGRRLRSLKVVQRTGISSFLHKLLQQKDRSFICHKG